MIKLIESGLFGNRLVSVEASLMVKRYNDCLTDIGLEPTKLTKFHIDGWGWSPEIAEEKDNRFYLSHGPANPYSIIITPEQKNSPLYFPYHTFDWDIHQMAFSNYELQIQDLTSQFGIWFELDQNVTAYRSPQDLLMMEAVNLNFKVAGDIMEAAKDQRSLISSWSDGPHSWLDSDLRERIIESSATFGDLRYRNLDLPTLPVSKISTYYTAAFGGLYIFKGLSGNKPMIIFEDNSSKLSNDPNNAHSEFNLKDKAFMPHFFNQLLLETEAEYFAEHRYLLELQLDHILVSAAVEDDPKISIHQYNQTQKKGLANKLVGKGLLGDAYLDLERLIGELERGNKDARVPASLNELLLHPTTRATKHQRMVLWQLISKIQNDNPVMQYNFDKAAFFLDYQKWTESKQHWAIESILKHNDIFHKLID